MDRDVVVVGAGPAGLITARETAERGVDVEVLEEHKEIGVPCHCAGLLSLKGLKEIGVPFNSDFVQNKIKGANFYSPSGFSFTVEKKEVVAYVIDRIKFDKFLARQTTRAGANIRLHSRAKQIKRSNNKIVVSGSWGVINASVCVDAEGVGSHFVRELGLKPLQLEMVLPALQYELTGVDVNSDYVEIYVGNKTAPNFFAWIIPLNSDSAMVGLACRGSNLLNRLENFVNRRFNNYLRLSVRSGRVITCGPIPKTFNDNFIVVGDAAGQVKQTTGGGVILGGICAKIAGRVVAEAVKTGSCNHRFLREYETQWRRRLDREFKIMRLARRIANRLKDKTIDKIFKVVMEKNLQNVFSKGDMDFQASILAAFAKKRDLLNILLAVAPDIIGINN